MKNVRVSTVLVGMAAVACLGGLLLMRVDEATGHGDTLSAVLFFAVLPVTAIAGFLSSVVILFRDRRPLRWVELAVSLALIVLLSQVH
jgi:hypothetical protein